MNGRHIHPLTILRAETGFCRVARLPLDIPSGDDVGRPLVSTLRLFEDGRELGPPHSLHADIRSQGGGRFSHWGREVFFSSSDGADPCTNGRVYGVATGKAVTIGDQACDEAARYAMTIAQNYLRLFRKNGFDPAGKTILELGPGDNLGAHLILASYGAEMIAADRFPAPEQPFHMDIYRRIAQVWDGPAHALKLALKQGSACVATRVLAEPAENLASLADGTIDAALSNAVLEHVYDPQAVAGELARVCRAGALNAHQVDFRDHNDFEAPLEHLLIPEDEFQLILNKGRHERGCRSRLGDIEGFFRANGFSIVECTANMHAAPQYLQNFLPRLRRSNSPYAGLTDEQAAVLAGFLLMHAPS